MENSPPPVAVAAPTGNDKIWAILSHVSLFLSLGLVLPLIVYLAMRGDSPYPAENAREALNFHITLVIYALACGLLSLVGIGLVLLALLGVASLVLAVLAAIRASEGQCYRYPYILRLGQ
jgi:hypothetical protein